MSHRIYITLSLLASLLLGFTHLTASAATSNPNPSPYSEQIVQQTEEAAEEGEEKKKKEEEEEPDC